MTTINPHLTLPLNKPSSVRSWLMQFRPVRTLWIAAKAMRYVCTLGVRQICWLVESLEHAHGHLASRAMQLPVDAAGQPLPWYTYPAIQYLSQLDLSEWDAFEFGSGNGSLFWAERTRSLVSIESDRQWHDLIVRRKLADQQVLLVEDLEQYPTSIQTQQRKFDLIIVDGKRRRPCAQAALKCLADDGMIILDNSDWYPKTAALLREAGLIQIDFSGYGPVNNYTWTTSLFLTRGVKLKPRGQHMPEPAIASLVQTADE
jgi:hypothetical protein